MKFFKKNWHGIALFVILAATGFLTFYAVDREGWANQYYSAAVKSMLSSWHNFFFVSFDPGGFVSVDKPALGLWLQALSAFIFGFKGWSLILPEALSAVISVAVLYHLVKKPFGKAAGIISALVMALTPILIAVSRTNNLDSSLVMLLLLAAWALVAAAERGSLKLVMLSMALVGLGFNVKMLQAFMVLPAFYLVYLLTASVRLRKRIIHLAAATAVLFAVSLSWAVIVDTTPASDRPYVGSSQTNSVIELALGYNGIQRITGDQNKTGKGLNMGGQGPDSASSAGMAGEAPQNSQGQPNIQAPPDNGRFNGNTQQGNSSTDSQSSENGANSANQGGMIPNGAPPQGFNPGNRGFGGSKSSGGSGGINFGGPGGVGENGQKGIFRVFNEQIAGQISWLIPFSLFGILSLVLMLKKKDNGNKRTDLRHLLLWSAWLAPMLAYFSIAGFFHRYYLCMLAPGIAALSGIGAVYMFRAYTGMGWKWVLLPSALIADGALEGLILSRYPEWKTLIPIVCGICLVSAIVLILIRLMNRDNLFKTIRLAAVTGMAALLVAPAIWCCTPIMYGSQSSLPVAGPELSQGNTTGRNRGINMSGAFNRGGMGMSQMAESGVSTGLVDFLTRNRLGEKYLVAVSSATSAAPIILQTGEPVMAVGGFQGSDPILTTEKLEKMVSDGEIRYFMVQGAGGGMGAQSQITSWVIKNGKEVSSDKWSSNSGIADQNDSMQKRSGMGGTLYDLTPEKGTI